MSPYVHAFIKFASFQKFLSRFWFCSANKYGIKKLYVRTLLANPYPRMLCLASVAPLSHIFVEKGEDKLEINEPKTNINQTPTLNEILTKADELYMNNEVDLLYEYLSQFKESGEAEILWRIARAFCDKAKLVSDVDIKKRLIQEAFSFAESGLRVGENNFACHKWYAILLDYVGEFQGTTERLLKAFEIKKHFLRAIELNGKDATSVHLLGYWCFVFADLSWYQRKLASLLFTSPPSSTYQEALNHFLMAEESIYYIF